MLWRQCTKLRACRSFSSARLSFNTKLELSKQNDPDLYVKSLNESTAALLKNLESPLTMEDLEKEYSDQSYSPMLPSNEPQEPSSEPKLHAWPYKQLSFAENTLLTAPSEDDEAPLRVYNFDTQKMVSNIKYAGSTRGQAEAITTALNGMLDETLERVKSRSLSNALAANGAYLFDSAATELRNELRQSRIASGQNLRGRAAHIQRDAEVLEHEMKEMTVVLRGDMSQDVSERKNAARTEESAINLKLQEQENRINVEIMSDCRSHIEQLRWQITRYGLTTVFLVIPLAAWIWFQRPVDPPQKSHEVIYARLPELAVPMLHPSQSGEYPEDVQVDELGNYSIRPN